MRSLLFLSFLLLTVAFTHAYTPSSRHFRRLASASTVASKPSFTDVFRAFVARYSPQLTDAQVASLAILPPRALADAALTVNSLAAADDLFMPWNQTSLWAASPTTSFAPLDVDAVFRAQRAPPTIMLIPGLMGEMFHRFLYEELMNSSSILSKRFADALQQCGGCADGVDDAFDMSILQPRPYSMADLVTVWSVDLPEGRPAAQFILFRSPLLSVETFSMTYAESSDMLYRRMTKVMNLLQKNTQFELYPMGYSRSAGIVMEMLQDPKWQNMPVRGSISLGGVHWGAQFADCGMGVLGRKAPLCTLSQTGLSVLQMLNDNLAPNLSKWMDNAGHIMSALFKMMGGAINTPSVPEMKHDEMLFPDLKSMFQNLVVTILQDLNLAKPISDYANRIRKEQVLMSHVLASIGTLTTPQCTQWHQTHTVPTNMPFYVLTNTQPDASKDISDDGKTHKLHPDSYSLRQQFYLVREASQGQQFNDGQVTGSRGSLLPALHRKLNPQQGDYSQQVQWLGIMNATHWASAFPVGTETDDGWVAPFPRAAFLMSIAHVIASDANARASLA